MQAERHQLEIATSGHYRRKFEARGIGSYQVRPDGPDLDADHEAMRPLFIRAGLDQPGWPCLPACLRWWRRTLTTSLITARVPSDGGSPGSFPGASTSRFVLRRNCGACSMTPCIPGGRQGWES
ncbi:MAG TPA: hypothetical protein VFJ58_22390 [Armatimonadota bacterium]|nr:hypothetical protein [Armatimonadota bacterium]